MLTSKEYKENLKNNIITYQMLDDALYSLNKRAKNHRDKAREYREYCHYNHLRDKYHNIQKENFLKEEFYDKKEILLTLLTPCAVHETVVTNYKTNKLKTLYFAYYEIKNGHSYHKPISKSEAKRISEILQIKPKEIEPIYNNGDDINDLMSVQFVNQMISLIESGNYLLIDENEVKE